ncbi:hypothetical protein P6F34_gp26 [Pseudomonas phage MiCath]|uniref:Uncharacterized protein n=1 Tax=Pseudomonas phage MiCath TaxID=3003729 RepID=A0AAF0AGU5_9CAUD|nr:hypothetical protein P6F34_gp26 [Pseudomonas phage MiCath]WAX22379.1 hypothetical protein [Pseudomonas phage MiCath]
MTNLSDNVNPVTLEFNWSEPVVPYLGCPYTEMKAELPFGVMLIKWEHRYLERGYTVHFNDEHIGSGIELGIAKDIAWNHYADRLADHCRAGWKEVTLARVDKQAEDLALLHQAYQWVMAAKNNVLHYVSMDNSDPAIRQMADGLGQESVGLLQALEARFAFSKALLSPKPMPRRQYFYRVDSCKADHSRSPDCLCWHDEGTGPLFNNPFTQQKPINWRDKP